MPAHPTTPLTFPPLDTQDPETGPITSPPPYAHTIYFADDSFLVFGEGVVPPPPGTCRRCNGTGLEPTSTPTSTLGTETQQPIPTTPQPLPLPSAPADETSPATNHNASARPALTFTCADELDLDYEYETYDFEDRVGLPVGLRSNVRVVHDEGMSVEERGRRVRRAVVFGGVDELGD